jgi:hypothetical protein
MNGTQYTILGVMSPGFDGVTPGLSTDIWVPMMMQAQLMRSRSYLDDMNTLWLRFIGRVEEGVTEVQASARANDVFHNLLIEEAGSEVTPEIEQSISQLKLELIPFAHGFAILRQSFSDPLLILMAVVGLVLLIACANVAPMWATSFWQGPRGGGGKWRFAWRWVRVAGGSFVSSSPKASSWPLPEER